MTSCRTGVEHLNSLKDGRAVFIDGEVAIFDSTIILEYVEDRWPNPALLPRLDMVRPPATAAATSVRSVRAPSLMSSFCA